MSETKFTPGPWEKDETAPYYISAEDGRNIATVHSGLFSNQEAKGNADLIASAPDLYAENIALRAALQNLIDEQNEAPIENRLAQWEQAMNDARAILSK
jgi:hypothetical protein